MRHDELRIDIDGVEAADLYADLLGLEVELDEELAGMFRMTLALLLRPDGSWTYLDDERLMVWRRVQVTAGLQDDVQPLLTGYITHVRPDFGPGLEACRLQVWGTDASVLMDRVERLKDWPNKKDSDIATETFQAYGLTPQVTDTGIVHDEAVSTVIQRETDIQLLRRLALRNGFECFVDGDRGYFRPPAVDDTPQPVLAVHFGEETNVNRFSLEVDALAPTDVAMFQIDHIAGDVLEAHAVPGSQTALGAVPAAGVLGPGMGPGLVYVAQSVATGVPEMTEICQSVYDQAEWLVTGEGEVAANEYGSILRPRSTVTVKGVGATHSGVYYVAHVTHRFTLDGYLQTFRIKRNALASKGDEDFSTGGADAAAGLPAAGALAAEVSL
ncbi:phage late control D family protein [Streptomyces sp. NPDC102406]|uniref:phage late control D family protein n=1 Tax=Streptomyces sp. NPDC102406 TaxID=3366171 RepID=UPI003821B446